MECNYDTLKQKWTVIHITGMARLICLQANIQHINSTAGHNKFFTVSLSHIKPKIPHGDYGDFTHNKSLNQVVYDNILLQGPQKIFGGPHAARGPQFGHVWYIIWQYKPIDRLIFLVNFIEGIVNSSLLNLLSVKLLVASRNEE